MDAKAVSIVFPVRKGYSTALLLCLSRELRKKSLIGFRAHIAAGMLRKVGIASFALVLMLVSPVFSMPANAGSVPEIGLNTELLSPQEVTVQPLQILTTSIRVTNLNPVRRRVKVSADVPTGWEYDAGPRILDLDAGESGIAFISIRLPVDAVPGQCRIALMAFPEEVPSAVSSVFVTMNVAGVARLEIRPVGPTPAQALSGGQIVQSFMMSNLGNAGKRVRIELETHPEWPCTIDPPNPVHILESGQSETVTVTTRVPDELLGTTTYHLAVLLYLDEPGAQVAARTSTSTRVDSRRLPEQSIYPTLQGRVQTLLDLRDDEGLSSTLTVGPLQSEIGRGRCLTVGPVNIPLGGGSGGTFTQDQRVSAAYEDKDRGYVRAGDFTLDLGSPLLERYLWGRGGDVLYTAGDLDYRVFYAHTRNSIPETDTGLQLVYHMGGGGILRLTGLRNSESPRSGDEDVEGEGVTNLGLYAGFEPVEGAIVAGELGGTWSSWSGFDPAWRISGKYRSERFSASCEWLKADADFRGGFRNRGVGRSDLSWRPQRDLSFWVNFNRSRSNIADKPDEEGMYERDFAYGAAWSPEDVGRFGISHRTNRRADAILDQFDYSTRTTEYSYSRSWGHLWAATALQLQDRDDRVTGDRERRRTFQLRCTVRIDDVTSIRLGWSSRKTTINDGEDSRRSTIANIGCDMRLHRDFDLSFNLQRNTGDLQGRRTNVNGSLGWHMSQGRSLSFLLRSYTGAMNNETEMALQFDYPVSVPLHMFPLRGRAEGRVVLADDPEHGVPGVKVLVGDLGVVTDQTGSFAFPALNPGLRQLTVDPASLGAGLMAAIELPLDFNISVGETTQLVIPLMRLASVGGHVLLEESAQNEQGPLREPLGGILIELLRQDGSDFRRTDDTGRFFFADLAPGTYTVILMTDSLPEYREIVGPATYEVDVAPGESRTDLVFVVRPVEREMEITGGDGGG